MKKILVIHGPNLDLLGRREPEVYGRITLSEINRALKKLAQGKKAALTIIQSNDEGKIVSLIGEARDKYCGLLINPAAYTHTSVAIRDALAAAGILSVEVHLSNIYAREDFRQKSLISGVVNGTIAGFGMKSYLLGLEALIDLLNVQWSPPGLKPGVPVGPKSWILKRPQLIRTLKGAVSGRGV